MARIKSDPIGDFIKTIIYLFLTVIFVPASIKIVGIVLQLSPDTGTQKIGIVLEKLGDSLLNLITKYPIHTLAVITLIVVALFYYYYKKFKN